MASPGTLNITSANAVYMISIAGLYPAPQQLQGFAVDEAFDTEVTNVAEAQIGVDGITGFGWIPRLTPQTITFMASSPSVIIFETWQQASDYAQNVYLATATVLLPATGRRYTFSNGTLTRYNALPNARRVLGPRTFSLVYGWPIVSAPI
jgi:hypothetical protein